LIGGLNKLYPKTEAMLNETIYLITSPALADQVDGLVMPFIFISVI